jgi:hypothetical protein
MKAKVLDEDGRTCQSSDPTYFDFSSSIREGCDLSLKLIGVYDSHIPLRSLQSA